MKKLGLIFIMLLVLLSGCGGNKKPEEQVVIDETLKDEFEDKDLEYSVMRKNAVILRCTKGDDLEEMLYTTDKKLVVGTYAKGVLRGLDNLETSKNDLEVILQEVYKCSYFDVQIVDDHLEYEYISTNIACFANVGLNYSLATLKEQREKEGYTCIVENEK